MEFNIQYPVDSYTAGFIDTFDPEEVFSFDPDAFDPEFDNASGNRMKKKLGRTQAREARKTARTSSRQQRKTATQGARIAARKESKLARIAAKGGAPLLQVDKNSVSNAAAKMGIAANEMQVPAEAVAATVAESPKAQERLTNYVVKRGETPAADPLELAAQAANMRELEIGEAMQEPPYTTEDPAEMEYNLLSDEYENEYLPEINETGDLEGFSNFVDPATWAAAKKVAEVGTDKARAARFKAGKPFLGETEAQYNARMAKKAKGELTDAQEVIQAGSEEYKKVYTKNWVNENLALIILVIIGIGLVGFYFGKK